MRAATLGDIFSMHTQQLGGLEDGNFWILCKVNWQNWISRNSFSWNRFVLVSIYLD